MSSIPDAVAVLGGVVVALVGAVGGLLREVRRLRSAAQRRQEPAAAPRQLAQAAPAQAQAAPQSERFQSSSALRVPGVGSPRAIRVLLVEDDPVLAKGYKSRLRLEGFEVDLAATPHDALLLWSEHRYDVLIADHYLPQVSGLALLGALRPRSILISASFIGDGSDAASIGAEGRVDRVMAKDNADAIVEAIHDLGRTPQLGS